MKTNFQKGFVVPLVIAIVVLAIAGGIYYTSTRNKDSSINGNGQELDGLIDRSASTTPLVGGDRDSHGCIGSAGYLWSEQKQQCVRPWEENASPTNITASCTKEARSCPDGSTVSRVAPSCAFRACPTSTTSKTSLKNYTGNGFSVDYSRDWTMSTLDSKPYFTAIVFNDNTNKRSSVLFSNDQSEVSSILKDGPVVGGVDSDKTKKSEFNERGLRVVRWDYLFVGDAGSGTTNKSVWVVLKSCNIDMVYVIDNPILFNSFALIDANGNKSGSSKFSLCSI